MKSTFHTLLPGRRIFSMKETTADDVAVQLVYADKVIFVPGFGLAQAQAQRELADLGELLKEHGVAFASPKSICVLSSKYSSFSMPA